MEAIYKTYSTKTFAISRRQSTNIINKDSLAVKIPGTLPIFAASGSDKSPNFHLQKEELQQISFLA